MSVNKMERETATIEFNNIQMKIMNSLDTRAKLRKHQENKIREYYSRIFKNENNSLAKQGISIRSSIGALSKTRKKQGFKVPVKKMTLKALPSQITSKTGSTSDSD